MRTSVITFLFCILSGTASVCVGMDDAALKEWLKTDFNGPESMLLEEEVVDEFRDRFAVTDVQLHRVLMELYREADNKRAVLTPKTQEWRVNQRTVESVIFWLPQCGGIPVKDFLLDYAAFKENDPYFRSVAVLSYLRVADAEETKNVLLRFLVGEERMDTMERMSLYSFARMVYNDASPEKKVAILASLIAAAGREDGKIEFMKVDKILAERSKAYQLSRERLAMLELHSMEPSTVNLYTDRDLKVALTESRNYKQYTSVSTNFTVLESQGYSFPKLLINDVTGDPHANPISTSETAVAIGFTKGRCALFGLITLLLFGFGAWKFIRK